MSTHSVAPGMLHWPLPDALPQAASADSANSATRLYRRIEESPLSAIATQEAGSLPVLPRLIVDFCGLLLEAFAHIVVENRLAESDRLRRHFDELVVVDELERVLERELARRREYELLVRGGGPDVRELLDLVRIDDEIIVTRVDAHDHAAVDLHVRPDEHLAALLEIKQAVRVRDAF